MISRSFRGQHGEACLFNNVVNINLGEADERIMTTGRHTVRDFTCKSCGNLLGWKYDKSFEESEKYKDGKFILEFEMICEVLSN